MMLHANKCVTCLSLGIAVPWLIMYILCFEGYYVADPTRWTHHEIPFISGMLGDQKDGAKLCHMRAAAWSAAIIVTCIARVVAYSEVHESGRIIRWMMSYGIVWVLTVVTAIWDAHTHDNPFRQWVSGGVLHFAASFLFFVVAGTETYKLNVVRLFPQSAGKMKHAMILYICVYCCLFLWHKIGAESLVDAAAMLWSDGGWLPGWLLPVMEHLMLFAHVAADCAGTDLLLSAGVITLPQLTAHEVLLSGRVIAVHPAPARFVSQHV